MKNGIFLLTKTVCSAFTYHVVHTSLTLSAHMPKCAQLKDSPFIKGGKVIFKQSEGRNRFLQGGEVGGIFSPQIMSPF